MGASTWEYVTPYEGSVEKSLAVLQDRLFAEEYAEDYGSIAELWADGELMGEAGTHSVLDVPRVVHTTDDPTRLDLNNYGTLRPLAPERIRHHFGTERPTTAQFERALADAHAELYRPIEERRPTLWGEQTMRWTGRYILLYDGSRDGDPSHVGIFGSSGD